MDQFVSPPVAVQEATPEPEPFDRFVHATEARLTFGLSPAVAGHAWTDWAIHMANNPEHRANLGRRAVEEFTGFWQDAVGLTADSLMPSATDHRFTSPAWQSQPFALFEQAFLRTQRWWAEATAPMRGVDRSSSQIVSFMTRQVLDTLSPSNLPFLNPDVIQAAKATNGANFAAGFRNFIEDWAQTFADKPAQPLKVGRDIAATKGKVVLRNDLIELIQYSPSTATVRPEPVLIVPAWIMKYYILDLSQTNSLVRYLVDQGFTVFCISWRNPGPGQRDLSFDDYRRLGVLAALDCVNRVRPNTGVHACGYCLGGTLLAVTAAAMARDNDNRLKTITMFCAQTDFTEAGELQLFITESQLAFLEDMMWREGYLDSRQMSGAFQLLRSNDLIWSRNIKTYMLGLREHPNDLMAWNADATRMPYRMHSEYLRRMFLDNDLAEGRLLVDGRPVSVGDIQGPFFVVGTETDHVAPWRSVYKFHLLNERDLTFVLTSGGHNAGIVSEPGHPHRHFRIHTRALGDRYIGPDEWFHAAEVRAGSWWPAWTEFLAAHSGEPVRPPVLAASLDDAPGQYVLEP